MNQDRRDSYRHAPPDLTEEERREWWERQRRKWVWGPGDVVITKRGGSEDDEDARAGS